MHFTQSIHSFKKTGCCCDSICQLANAWIAGDIQILECWTGDRTTKAMLLHAQDLQCWEQAKIYACNPILVEPREYILEDVVAIGASTIANCRVSPIVKSKPLLAVWSSTLQLCTINSGSIKPTALAIIIPGTMYRILNQNPPGTNRTSASTYFALLIHFVQAFDGMKCLQGVNFKSNIKAFSEDEIADELIFHRAPTSMAWYRMGLLSILYSALSCQCWSDLTYDQGILRWQPLTLNAHFQCFQLFEALQVACQTHVLPRL